MSHIAQLLLIACSALAQDHGGAEHEGPVEIPWGLIVKQVVNVAVISGVLVYFLRAQIKAFFKNRAESFEKLLVLAKKVKEDAELEKKDISARLERLAASANDSVEKSKREAADLKVKLQAEAEALAKQIREEAAKTVDREIQKARQELREELLSQAMTTTRETMKTSVKETDQTRLQNEFVEKIQVNR
jgi:F-type H+-transporting ATPase subunit b